LSHAPVFFRQILFPNPPSSALSEEKAFGFDFGATTICMQPIDLPFRSRFLVFFFFDP